jgi:hypothetical protein
MMGAVKLADTIVNDRLPFLMPCFLLIIIHLFAPLLLRKKIDAKFYGLKDVYVRTFTRHVAYTA